MFTLKGRGVVITGGGGHLGAAMALGVAEVGGSVVICGRRSAPLQTVVDRARSLSLPGRVRALTADLNRDDDVMNVIEMAEGELGGLYGWVNNAYAGRGGGLLEGTFREFEESVHAGLTRVMAITQLVAKRMVEDQTHGAIVNIASMYGLVSPQPATYTKFPEFHNPPAYGAAKAGLLQFTRYAACHLAPHGIRVNAISPGPFPGGGPEGLPDFVEELNKRVPLGRIGKPEELAGAVAFLLSTAAGYITGHNLVVDGGWTAW